MKILVVEDDIVINGNICDAFNAENMQAKGVFEGALALRMLSKEHFDCVIIDVNLPNINGYDVCKKFREQNQTTPILMLTAFSELEDKIMGYDSGADDYLTKPFYMKELILRVQSLIKRSGTKANNHVLKADDILIDTKAKTITRAGNIINLTPREFQIITHLVENKNELVSKRDLVNLIWGNVINANTNTVEVYINFLRNKIDKPFGKSSIKTKVGYGYILEVE